MANKKLQKSVDTVKSEVRELAQAFWALREELMTHEAVRAAEDQSSTKRRRAATKRNGDSGERANSTISMSGNYVLPDSSGRVATWSVQQAPVDAILNVGVDHAAGILGAVGHRQRLAITLELLRHPATASTLVSTLDLGTTGAAYHHLNVLQGAGLVTQEQRGLFSITPGMIPVLLIILTGLSDALDAHLEVPEQAEEQPDSTDTNGEA